ncbi:MAG: peptidylprolyl isomerase [Eubacterium sp.]|nr:peptidylprolyl isomerase [Eubacterium sp.]
MAKKQFDDDLLAGGSLNTEKDKQAKKAEKLTKKNTKSKGIAPKTVKAIKAAVCVVIVVALLVTYVATGAVRKGFVSYLGIPAHFTGMTVTNGENKAKIKVGTYNFYFASSYNNLASQQSMYEQYGIDLEQVGLKVDLTKKLSSQTYTDPDTNEEMSWAEHMHDMVVESIESVYTYYLAAVAENGGKDPEITEEQQTNIDDTLSQYEKTANSNGYTLDAYLTLAMGKGVNEAVFRTESTRQYIAQNYQSNMSANLIEEGYSEDEINAYKDENLDDLVTVDIKLFECESEDEAKEFAGKLKSDGSNFADLCSEYSTDEFYKKAYAEDGYSTEYGMTKAMLQSRGYAIATADTHEHEDGEEHSEDEETTYSGLDWLFSSDRKAGDINNYSTTVVYVISPASLSDRKTIDVRHILIAPETENGADATEATDAQWTAAFDKARDILSGWDKTEDGFAQLAMDNSSDGSAADGGLYSNVVTGQMVNSFSAWCFDDARKAGDTAIVRSDYGYHIMYFVGKNDQTIWQYTVEQTLASQDSSTLAEKLEEEYTVKENWFGSRYFEKDVDISN